MSGETLKQQTANTLGWNTVDRVSSQVLYAITGIVLANVLGAEDFGLVGVITIFQAFAVLFVDSGFGAALLQKQNPDEADYSTVFWFNLGVSLVVYAILWVCAPMIAGIFHDDRLIALSRVMFLNFVLTALSIVQTNRLMKKMDVRQVAISNVVGLSVSGALGIWMAVSGYGAWALVWQTLTLSVVKCVWLWVVVGWRPRFIFSRESLRSIWRVGAGVFSGSFLNTLFLNIYSFLIGAWYSLGALGLFTQADKWSKMGVASLSQIMTATFIPVLSKVQDDMARFRHFIGRINRLAAFLLFPFMLGLAVMATTIFHTLFGSKWDGAILMFQILMLRGVFVVLTSLYNNYVLAQGKAARLVAIEMVKDLLTLGAIAATIPFGSVIALVWGQFAASVATYVVVLVMASRANGYPVRLYLQDNLPYMALTIAVCAVVWFIGCLPLASWLLLAIQTVVGIGLYVGVLKMAGSQILKDALAYLRRKR